MAPLTRFSAKWPDSSMIFIEWLNTVVRTSWSYIDLMPTLPVIGSGKLEVIRKVDY
jgi:hypothetical protein